jgi:ATP-dependent Clp endopeptidase proteolytic subunit ClpP
MNKYRKYKFFNIIPSDNGTACILLYGDIGLGDINPSDVVAELMQLQLDYKNIDFRINSMGGEVASGLAILTALKSCQANITIYIDGIAASMAAVVALCGKPVKMSQYGQLMLHSVQGGAYGTTEDMQNTIKTMTQLQDSLAQIISDKCGQPKENILKDYFDGNDHWLTAQQALDLKLVDEIYTTNEPMPMYDNNPQQVYQEINNRYTNQLKVAETELNNQSNIKQMLEELRKRPEFANCADDRAILNHLDELTADAAKLPELNQKIIDLTKEVTTYKEKVTAFENKEKEVQTAADKAYIDAAIAAEKFPESERETYTNLLDAARESTKKIIDGMPAKKHVLNDLEPNNGNHKGAWEQHQEEIRNNAKNKFK